MVLPVINKIFFHSFLPSDCFYRASQAKPAEPPHGGNALSAMQQCCAVAQIIIKIRAEDKKTLSFSFLPKNFSYAVKRLQVREKGMCALCDITKGLTTTTPNDKPHDAANEKILKLHLQSDLAAAAEGDESTSVSADDPRVTHTL